MLLSHQGIRSRIPRYYHPPTPVTFWMCGIVCIRVCDLVTEKHLEHKKHHACVIITSRALLTASLFHSSG